MNKAAPWNVRGVGLDTREAAREAARRAGLSLGDWLDSVIAEQANSLGIEAEDIDADDRLDAVTARLSQMTGKPLPERSATRTPSTQRPTIRPARPARAVFDDHEEYNYSRSDAGPSLARRDAPPPVDPETLLDAAVARMERRSGQAQKQTNAALESVAARLGDIESQITARREDNAIQPIKSALGRLEERIESLSRRPAPPRTDARVEASLRDLTDRLDDVAAKIDRNAVLPQREPDTSHIQRLDARMSAVLTQLQEQEAQRARLQEQEAQRTRTQEQEAQRTRTQEQEARRAFAREQEAERARLQDNAAQLLTAQRRAAQPLRGIGQVPFAKTVSDIVQRQRDLAAGISARTAPAPLHAPVLDEALERRLERLAAHVEKAADTASGAGRASDKAFANLQAEIARLAARLDEPRIDPPKAPESHPDLAQLKRDITDMSRAVGELAPRGSVAALETAVRDLATRIELSRQDGARDNLLAPVESLVSDLHTTLKNFDPRQPIFDLEREIKTIGRKVETMTLAGFDPDAFKRIHSQSQEIRDLLTAAASRPLPFDKLEKQIAALGTRVDHLAHSQAQPMPGDVSSAIGEIRTLFDRAMVDRAAPGQYIATLEKRLESLAQKIDVAVTRPATVIPAPVADTSGLERMIARLAERMEATRKNTQDPAVFEALQQQIAHIGQRLDTSDASFKSLGSIERSISGLFDGLEKTRAAAIAAAESAARVAAAEAAEKSARANLQTMQEMPQSSQSLAQSQAIQRDLMGIRAEQDAAGKRGHATLNAVHGTLEKIVDRLATLESRKPDQAGGGVEENRRIAIEVAESAARITASEAAEKAARANLREMMQNPPQNPQAIAQAQAIQRDLMDIRAEQDAASKRGHATLNAVHGTLEKIVDRLATLEDIRHTPDAAMHEETRRIAIEVAASSARMAASEAAEKAARESLRDIMQHPPQNPQAIAQSQAIQRDLMDIRAEQDASSKRGHATLNAVHGTLEKIVDRLATLEGTRPGETGPDREETRSILMEAARGAARETLQEVRDLLPTLQQGPQADALKRDLADLRHAQEEAGERTHSTLIAVHQTLERMVDRLSTLEDERVPGALPLHLEMPSRHAGHDEVAAQDKLAPIFSPAPRRFDVSVDADTLRPRATPRWSEPEVKATPRVETRTPASAPLASLPTADGLDMLLEPGSGLPPHRGSATSSSGVARGAGATAGSVLHAAAEKVAAGDAPQPNSFIAAARRAAQTAAAETASQAADKSARGASAIRAIVEGIDSGTAIGKASGALDSAKTFVRLRKKPILIGLTGLAVILGAAMVARTFLGGTPNVQKVEAMPLETGAALSLVAQAEVPQLPPASPAPAAHTNLVPITTPSTPQQAWLPTSPSSLNTIASGTTLSPAIAAPPIAGDVASRTQPRISIANPVLPAAPLLNVAPARSPGASDPTPVGSIDGKANPQTQVAASSGISTPLRVAALAGSAGAQYEIGMRYVEGRGVARDLKLAAQWLEQSANQGLAPAQYRIGSLYEKGLGVAKDAATAKKWYQRSADGGNVRAMHNLAVLTAEGVDGKPDYAGAAIWFKKAAEFGVRDSQYNLAILYARGLGIEQSLAQSYTWFAIAAGLGDDDAAKKRDEVAGKLDAKALAAAKAIADSFHAAAAVLLGNDVAPPTGGWDGAPQKTELGVKMPKKV